MSDVETDEIFEEGIAKNEVVEEPEKPPIKKKTKKVTKIEEEKEPLLPEDENPDVAPKKVKKKRVLTPESKQRLLDNLARGRATSLANRKKKAQLRKIEKEEAAYQEDERIFQALKKKQRPKELEDENIRLREELATLKSSMSKPKEQKEQKEASLIQVRSKPTIIEEENKAVKPIKPKPVEKLKPAKKELSKREIQKLMRGL
jgi:hypothetical protein